MMRNQTIQKSTLQFLKRLSQNNDRDWFNANKQQYHKALENVEQFFDQLILKMNVHDQIDTPSGKKSVYRIYNDVRFSKDKSPYNPRFAGYLKRTKPFLRGGYYLWIKPGASRIGCGFIHPNTEDLKRIRLDILRNYDDWYKLLKLKSIQTNFGEIQGTRLKTSPRGFPADHHAADLLQYQQYWFERTFSDMEVLSHDFISNVNKRFRSIRPFFDYMSDVLTTDVNGEHVARHVLYRTDNNDVGAKEIFS